MIGRGRRRLRARWWPWLTLWCLVGLGIRLGTVAGRPNRVAGGDAYYYHNAANLLVAGEGFINPFLYYPHHLHHHVQTASWPPLFVLVLATASVVGFKSFLAQRVWCCLIGTAVIAVCGYVGKEVGGRRVGLITAFLVAVYPNIWMNDELAMSEAFSPLLVALVLLTAYRFWRRPSWWRAAALGATIGLAALGRDELSLLAVFILLPLALMAKVAWRKRFAFLGAGALTAALLVAPWIGYNMSRFEKPVFISSGLGITLVSANCNTTYYGRFLGYWSFPCALQAPINPHVDESVQASEAQAYALRYIRAHEGRLPAVVAARLGRAFGFFHPLDQISLDSRIETRPYHWALVGLGMYYVLFALSIGGVVILRRRKVPIGPLLAIGLDVVVAVALTFGQTRYRTTFEVSLCVLAAVQLGWLWDHLRRPAMTAGEGQGAALPPGAGTSGEGQGAPGEGQGAAGEGQGAAGDRPTTPLPAR